MASIPILREAAPERPHASSAAHFSERVAAALALAAASPVLCLSAAAVALLSGKSPLVAHRRVGWRGSTLWMLKLRTMWDRNSPEGPGGWVEYIDDEAGPLRKDSADPRVPNAFARFCRRHSLDEVPQLLHIIRGEMSFIGPRPLTARELRLYYGDDAWEILNVKPGIAGLWQVSGRNRLTYAQRRSYDLKLVRERSFKMYLRIAMRTVVEVCSGANTW